jgi:outer membrane protein assembly factor BamB
VPTDLPVWGSPVVDDDQVFFGLGNGRLLKEPEPPEKPAGSVLCLSSKTGQTLWRRDLGEAIFAHCAVDKERLYCGARDGYCYCLDRREGGLIWSRDLGSPIVTSPSFMDGRVYLVASAGPVCCLESATGKPIWSFDVAKKTRTRPQMLSSPVVVPEQGGGHFIFFGAELKNAVNSAALLYCLRD